MLESILDYLRFDLVIFYIILAIASSYLYKAIKQIIKRDISFYKQEIYTGKSVEKWAIVDGLLKASTSVVCIVYGILNLVGITVVWYVIAVFAFNVVLYIVLYRVVLQRKDSTNQS
ncbi:MAG: hypothetical protein IJS84_00520 [Spirochaetales bacterium]|nr:hypothetical protein [Spirochaetales bacterium]